MMTPFLKKPSFWKKPPPADAQADLRAFLEKLAADILDLVRAALQAGSHNVSPAVTPVHDPRPLSDAAEDDRWQRIHRDLTDIAKRSANEWARTQAAAVLRRVPRTYQAARHWEATTASVRAAIDLANRHTDSRQGTADE